MSGGWLQTRGGTLDGVPAVIPRKRSNANEPAG